MCPGGVLPDTVPQPAHEVRQAAAPPALAAHRLLYRHRATLLRQTGRQDAHRDPHQVSAGPLSLSPRSTVVLMLSLRYFRVVNVEYALIRCCLAFVNIFFLFRQGHAALRIDLQLALHGQHVTGGSGHEPRPHPRERAHLCRLSRPLLRRPRPYVRRSRPDFGTHTHSTGVLLPASHSLRHLSVMNR